MRKPDFFIVGAPRCGTTAMKSYLGEHPEIFIPPADIEPHFFGSDMYQQSFIRDEQEYLSLFAGAKDERRVGEKSTRYLYSERAAVEIKEYQPSASIIVMLRNPVDQLYSLHNLRLYIERENIVDFEAALEAEEDRKRGLRLPDSISLREAWTLTYREIPRYTHQVQRYLDVFGRRNVHIIIFDDFISDLTKVYGDTLRFLRVDPGFQPEFRKISPSRRVRSRTVQSLLTNRPQFVRSFMKVIMPLQLRKRVFESLFALNLSYAPRPPMRPELRRQLQEEFLPEVEQLSRLLGRDLTHWCKG
ncbi:MAG: sulfotransferase [bacterium]|nr:sulfotransferase [bacterium]